MELLVAVALSSLVIAGVSAITSFVMTRHQHTRADQALAQDSARVRERLTREFREIMAWHVMQPQQLVYTSSYLAPGEILAPSATVLLCRKSEATGMYSLVYQRIGGVPTKAEATRGERGKPMVPEFEAQIASGLTACAVEFGVMGATAPNKAMAVQWVKTLLPSDEPKVTRLLIAMSDANGRAFPIVIFKNK